MTKLQSLVTRNLFNNAATGLHPDLKMAQLVMTRTFSPKIKGLNTPRITSLPTVYRGWAGYFSWIPSICSKRAQKCQTSSFIQTLLWLKVWLYKGVTGQVYPGILTHPSLELQHEICPGLSKYAMHSSLEFMPSRTSHIWTDCIWPTISGFKKTSDILPLWGAYIEYPLPTEWGTCGMATSISEKMGGPHVEDSLSPWTRTNPPSSSHPCPFCNKSHSSRDSLINHVWFHYRMVLVCPICGSRGWNHWRIVKGHIKKCAVAQPNVADRVVEPGKPHWRKSNPPLRNHTTAAETEATYTLSVWPDTPSDEDATDWGQIFKYLQMEWTVQVQNIREAAAAEAPKANKDDGEVNKDSRKKPNWNLNEPLTKLKGNRRAPHWRKLTFLMTISMSTSVQFKIRAVKRLQMSCPLKLQRSQKEQNWKMCPKVPAIEEFTNHLEAQLVKVPLSLPPSWSNLHNRQWSQSLKIHHHQAAQAVTVSPQMRRKSAWRRRWRNFLHLHQDSTGSIQNLDLTLQHERVIDKSNQDLQAEMIDTDVTGNWEDHILGLKDPHLTQEGLGDHTQEIGDHPTEGENPHLPPQQEV